MIWSHQKWTSKHVGVHPGFHVSGWHPSAGILAPAAPAAAAAGESIRVSDCLSFWHMIANAAH